MTDKKNLNIMFFGGAKRVAMGHLFIEAARRAGYVPRLFSFELNERVPLACMATIVTGPKVTDPAVIDRLHQVCTENDIDILVPFIDGAVGVCARYARLYPGQVFVPTGSPEAAAAMFDKVLAADLFERQGLPAPATWRGGTPKFPLIAKPRCGSASKGIVAIDSQDDLDSLVNPDDYLIQQRIDRRREITVDCYASVMDGTVLAAVPRLRDEVSGGEVSRTTVVQWPLAEEMARLTIASCNLRGAVTVQLIHDLDSDRLMIMEVNPRLGGGCVASVKAGADIPAMIIAEATGQKPRPCTSWHRLLMTRYPADVCFDLDDDKML